MKKQKRQKLRDASWRYLRALGHNRVADKRKKESREACRKPKKEETA